MFPYEIVVKLVAFKNHTVSFVFIPRMVFSRSRISPFNRFYFSQVYYFGFSQLL
jgi:hypothetical protein